MNEIDHQFSEGFRNDLIWLMSECAKNKTNKATINSVLASGDKVDIDIRFYVANEESDENKI